MRIFQIIGVIYIIGFMVYGAVIYGHAMKAAIQRKEMIEKLHYQMDSVELEIRKNSLKTSK